MLSRAEFSIYKKIIFARKPLLNCENVLCYLFQIEEKLLQILSIKTTSYSNSILSSLLDDDYYVIHNFMKICHFLPNYKYFFF